MSTSSLGARWGPRGRKVQQARKARLVLLVRLGLLGRQALMVRLGLLGRQALMVRLDPLVLLDRQVLLVHKVPKDRQGHKVRPVLMVQLVLQGRRAPQALTA